MGGDRRTWIGRLLIAVMIIAGACSQNDPNDPFSNYNPDDPFNDPFFNSSFGGTDSLNEIWDEPSPNVGWLYDGDGGAETALDDHSDPFWDDEPGSDEFGKNANKTFSEKAQEASMATLSILVGAGMTALPFLLGT